MLYDLYKRVQFEVLASTTLLAIVYGIFAAAIMVWWGGAVQQVVYYYATLREFDVSPTDFLWTAVVLFLPLVVVGGLLARGLIQRIRLNHWFKNHTSIVLYDTTLTPAEAGYIADYQFSHAEVYATLLDMHFRGLVTIHSRPGGLLIQAHTMIGANTYESTLLHALFSDAQQIAITTIVDPRIDNAGSRARLHLNRHLHGKLVLPGHEKAYPFLTSIVRGIYFMAGLAGCIVVYGEIFRHEEVNKLMYPRFGMELWQPLLVLGITGILVAIVISGWWPRFAAPDRHASSSSLWLQAVGFRQYLQGVYKQRLSQQYLHTQNPEDIRAYTPFLLAFQIAPVSLAYIQEVLSSADRS